MMTTDDEINFHDIAALAGVTKWTVAGWRIRDCNFPRPIRAARAFVYSRAVILLYLEKKLAEEKEKKELSARRVEARQLAKQQSEPRRLERGERKRPVAKPATLTVRNMPAPRIVEMPKTKKTPTQVHCKLCGRLKALPCVTHHEAMDCEGKKAVMKNRTESFFGGG
jgi:hypothetical protein